MPTIDLSTPPPPPTGLLDGLPRRLTLTLAELRLVADRAGGAPLPFDIAPPTSASALDGRLGQGRGSVEDEAYRAALASLHDPEAALVRRGLLHGNALDPGLSGAVGLLATPTTAVDVDVTAAGTRARSWHRYAGGAVATLSTVDGVVFELAWFAAAQWPAELGRIGVLPEELQVRASDVPALLDLPFELVDAAAEAVRSGRSDLLAVLAARHSGQVLDGSGGSLPDPAVTGLLMALTGEAQGRLRVLVADVSGHTTSVVGVVSWTLLADGWHALRPRHADGGHRVLVAAVEPSDLGAELAPVLAEVTR
jgi:hypothetical protein